MKLKSLFNTAVDKYIIKYSHKNEIRKYKDSRRKAIYSEVTLTDEQKESIDELYLKNYGKKIPYTWHRHYTAFTGHFDVNYFPELLYIPEFEYYMNMVPHYRKVLSDKNLIPLIAKAAGVKTPELLFSCTKEAYRDTEYRFLSKKELLSQLYHIGEVFIKPSVDTSSGRNCRLADVHYGIDVKSGISIDDILNKMGTDYVIQKRLRCSDSIKKFYSGGVNTFRIVTYRWNDHICFMPPIMRFGRNGRYLDNAHAGGGFVGINREGLLMPQGFTEFKDVFTKHPDTGIVFDKYKIDNFEKVIDSAKKMHELIPQIGCINWDYTIDENEDPVLIEANMNGGSVWMIEMAHGKGPFGDRTAEILQWLRLMNSLKLKERKNHMFGKM